MRFIQVGVGGFGRVWVSLLASDEEAEIAALVDVDEAALARGADTTGVSGEACFSDFREAFSQVEADAVVNVTPPAVHRDVLLAAFEQGLDVLTEKPLAADMDSARELVEAADEADCTLMVSQNYRFRRWAHTVEGLLAEESVDLPDNISVRFAAAPRFAESFRRSMEHPLVVDMSIHHFDLMRALTGLEPRSVYATTWRPAWSWFEHDPCCMAVFQFEQGLKVCYDASWVSRGRQTSSNGYWRIECRQLSIELLSNKVHVLQGPGDVRDAEVEMRDLPCEDQAYSLMEFRRAIEEGRQPEASGRDNLNSLAMVYAVLKSSHTGAPVEIEEV